MKQNNDYQTLGSQLILFSPKKSSVSFWHPREKRWPILTEQLKKGLIYNSLLKYEMKSSFNYLSIYFILPRWLFFCVRVFWIEGETFLTKIEHFSLRWLNLKACIHLFFHQNKKSFLTSFPPFLPSHPVSFLSRQFLFQLNNQLWNFGHMKQYLIFLLVFFFLRFHRLIKKLHATYSHTYVDMNK